MPSYMTDPWPQALEDYNFQARLSEMPLHLNTMLIFSFHVHGEAVNLHGLDFASPPQRLRSWVSLQ